MKRQHITLRIGWKAVVLYMVNKGHAPEVAEALREAGAAADVVDTAIARIEAGNSNEGITYSNLFRRVSVMVVGRATSRRQLANSIAHEQLHMLSHICEEYSIDMHSERAAYIFGDITMQMYPSVHSLLCTRCHDD